MLVNNHIFYAYGVFYILRILYWLFNKKPKKSIHVTQSNMQKLIEPSFIFTITDILWVVTGAILSLEMVGFISLLIMNIIIPLLIMNREKEVVTKLHRIWSVTKIALVLIILYWHYGLNA